MGKLGKKFVENVGNNIAKLVECSQKIVENVENRNIVTKEVIQIECLTNTEKIKAIVITDKDSSKTNILFEFCNALIPRIWGRYDNVHTQGKNTLTYVR